MRVRETFVALFNTIPVPIGVADESSTPVELAIVPPEQPAVLALVQVPPVPVTVKLPEVPDSMMPLGPPLAETVVSETVSGVVPLARVISTAVDPAPEVLMVPLGMVIFPVFSVASKPRLVASGVMVRAPKVSEALFVVRLIPVSPDPVTDVAAKLSVPAEPFTLMPMPVEFVTVVEPVVKVLPATRPLRLIPVVALFVEEMLPKVPFRVPVVRFSAFPVPFNVTSETLSVPKLVPVISEVALPPVNPRKVLPEPTVIPLPVMFTIAPVGFGGGKASLPTGGLTPEIEERVAVASCPINFWPLSKVTGPT